MELGVLAGEQERGVGGRRDRQEAVGPRIDGLRATRGDRDMEDVAPEVNEARKRLKQAIKAAAKNPDPIAQRRLADILRRAAEEIERTGGAPQPEPEIDI